MKENKGISLVLTLLIMSSILTGAVIVGDVLIRHGQVIQGSEVSEIAYFASKAGIERTAYQVLKNYENIGSISASGEISSGGTYNVTNISTYADEPNGEGEINDNNDWEISLEPGETFFLGLDINGADYPTDISFSKSGNVSSDLVIFQCSTTDGECSGDQTQSFDVDFPYSLDTSSFESENYEISIKNSGNASENYVIAPNERLPIGVNITSKGVYSSYERQIKATFRKWQKYGI